MGVILQGAGFDQNPKNSDYKLMALEDNKNLLVYGIFGEKDRLRNEIPTLQKVFPKHTVREFKMFSGGHNWAPAECMTEALDWIQSHSASQTKAGGLSTGLRPLTIPTRQ